MPLDKVVTQLNMDMVGRDRDNKASESNTVYVVGSDRISTELHNIDVAADEAMPQPLTLDYEMNDPTDLEQVYYRSDHDSYAATGIPIIFFTTGLHPDYHANTDSVDKIHFEKMARIGRLVYETGWKVAELDHAPVRDNKGPRAGKGLQGCLPMKTSSTGRQRLRPARGAGGRRGAAEPPSARRWRRARRTLRNADWTSHRTLHIARDARGREESQVRSPGPLPFLT